MDDTQGRITRNGIRIYEAADFAGMRKAGEAAALILDAVAPLVRARLGLAEAAFPLARVLEGGTWAAGRRLAAERRADGGPPLRVVSDGTVF